MAGRGHWNNGRKHSGEGRGARKFNAVNLIINSIVNHRDKYKKKKTILDWCSLVEARFQHFPLATYLP